VLFLFSVGCVFAAGAVWGLGDTTKRKGRNRGKKSQAGERVHMAIRLNLQTKNEKREEEKKHSQRQKKNTKKI